MIPALQRTKIPGLQWILLAAAVLYPLVPAIETQLSRLTGIPIGLQLTYIYIYAILALALNVVVGYTGLLHLGIAAFFGIGAYITGILTVPGYPFQVGFIASLVAATLGAALMGVMLGAPTLRLRGDYLAIVTLGFGEVVRFALKNLEEITAGTRGLNPVPPPQIPAWLGPLAAFQGRYQFYYFLVLALLVVVVALLRNIERSQLGRSWIAVREDELAASCMGINVPRVKLASFALAAGLAGLAGCLYATTLKSTAQPDAYDFNRSIIMLCCIILGGLGSIRGTLLGVVLLMGFDLVVAPIIDSFMAGVIERLSANSPLNESWRTLLTFSNWKLMIFGLALIMMMRLRPEGLLPSRRTSRIHSLERQLVQPALTNAAPSSPGEAS